ncbi:hypothetical protein EJ02DRAFT_148062 [Clathrospora elynae]|uniref:AA9 family lytic polysaccharide monooxygenase n=1 Tax=Clathrospora elynae TaxID=706981 RepID=A0A6A5STX1_9PLEO|nr:hypothetical protein EJ02DRAFT_148062 [Clathrospora elynae]
MLFGPVDDASEVTAIVAGWFKIDELDNVGGKWASEIMGANNMTHEFTLPTGLASGDYLLRSEILALHGAQTVGGAQFYIGCAQLKINGTGSSGSCTPSIEIPGAYDENDESINIPNIYNGFDASTYKAPGGPVASCGGSGGAAPSKRTAASAPANSTVAASPSTVNSSVVVAPISTLAPAPSANATIPTTFVRLVHPSADAPIAVATGGNSTGVAEIYYTCGGIGYAGPTACEGAATCVKINDYYSQCRLA